MARALWKGNLTFGLVNIPISLYSGETREEIGFTLLDKRDMSPVGYKKISKKSGREVPREEIVRGFEFEKGEYVVVTDDDLKRASPEKSQQVEIKAFVHASEVDPAYFDKPYYLEPAAKSDKVYSLLRDVLKKTGKIGVATVVIRAKEYLAALLPRAAMLELCLLRYEYELKAPDELRLPQEDAKSLKPSASELKMAERLVEDLSTPWDPAQYKDAYREQLLDIIRKKASAGKVEEVEMPKRAKAPEAPADIMAMLKKSVAQAETSKGRGAPRSRYLH